MVEQHGSGPLRFDATKLLITADAGGSNGYRVRGLEIPSGPAGGRDGPGDHRLPLSPGTSKWNRIEHRMFSFITTNWRGRPLTTYRTIIELIAATTTKTGLRIRAEHDTEWYPTGVKITNGRWPPYPSPPTNGTATGTTPSPPRKRLINSAGRPKGPPRDRLRGSLTDAVVPLAVPVVGA